MFCKCRADWFDVSDEIIESVNDKELLAKEYAHVNKLLQQMNTDIARFLQWLMGSIVLALGAIFSTIYGFGIKVIEKEEVFLHVIKDFIEFVFFQVGLVVGFIFLFFLLINLLGTMASRKKLVLRKEKTIKLLNNFEEKRKGEICTQ